MKKGIAAVSAFAMAAVMCAGFAACGSKSEAEKIVSDKVTQAEWEAAFAEENFTNCKLELRIILEYDDNVAISYADTQSPDIGVGSDPPLTSGSSNTNSTGSKLTASLTYIQDGEKCYCKIKLEGKNVEESFLRDEFGPDSETYWADGKSYTVTKDGVTVKESVEMEYVYRRVPKYLKDYYADFEYSEEAKGYGNNLDTPNYSIVKFQNGKLVAYIDMDPYHAGEGWTMKYEYVFTYGGQTVTLPKV